MGRNKYSQKEIEKIGKLLRLKNSVNRFKQKMIRHELRVTYEFNISDFNEPGKAFGEEELQAAVKRGAIEILDDATIEAMKAKRARDKARDEAARQQEAIANGEEINKCPPGGMEGVQRLADLLGREVKALDAEEKPKAIAIIDENTCIGCTL